VERLEARQPIAPSLCLVSTGFFIRLAGAAVSPRGLATNSQCHEYKNRKKHTRFHVTSPEMYRLSIAHIVEKSITRNNYQLFSFPKIMV